MSLKQLPTDILFSIFSKLKDQETRCTLPLVCKAWRDICSPPSSLWHSIIVDVRKQATVLLAPAQRFFQQRAKQLKSLQLFLTPEEAGFAALILASLGNDSPLKRLCVDFGGARLACTLSFLAQLGWMKQVRALKLSGLQGTVTSAHLQGLVQLRHLKAIKLSFSDSSCPALPDGFPSALLRCTRLETLHISNAGHYAFATLPEGLGNLSNLREMTFDTCGVHAFPNDFTGLTNLETLAILEAYPRHLKFPHGLSALVKLERMELECRRIPTELKALPALKHLTLLGLRRLHRSFAPEKDFAELLGNLELESLSIRSSLLGTVPHALTCQHGLHSLTLCRCDLTDLPPGPYLLTLRHLDLSDNNFDEVPAAVLSAPALEILEGFAERSVRGLAPLPPNVL